MTAAVQSALVVGAGVAGSAVAAMLARGGVEVDLVEIKPHATALGSGITLQGNALRVLQDLGVWDTVAEHGYAFDTLGIRAPDEHGTVLVEMPDARTGGPDLPAALGIERPLLAGILLDNAETAGVKVRFCTTTTALKQDDGGVEVSFSDGSTKRYDLVIGADGVRSWTRRALGIELDTKPTGMGIWRLVGSRPASVTRTDLYYGGVCYIAGYCPTGDDSMYAYLVEDAQDRSTLTPEERLDTMRALAANYHGPWDEIRDGLTDPEAVNYTWFESHVLDAPWNRGRVVLIGDAAHVCPPTLAQGGAQALEDASVLAELLLTKAGLDQQLWDEFAERRIPRARSVVEASLQLGTWMLDHTPDADVPGLMGRISALVSERA